MFANTVVRAPGRFGRLVMAAGLFLPLVAAVPPAVVAGEEDEEAGSVYARVRWLDAGLSVERPSEGEILTASANLPVIPGDKVWTGAGRAEIELADSSVIWLDDGTRIEVRNLADYDNRYERTNLLVLRRGAIRIDNRDAGNAESTFQIDTEAGSIFLLSGGSFRVETDGSETIVSCFSGVAEFSGEGGSVLVRSGQRSSVAMGAVPDEPRRFNTSRSDDFDRFHGDRLAVYSTDDPAQVAVEEVPVEVRPYVRELSSYGTWTTMAPYGVVWRPVFASGWTPYSHGAWGWYPNGWVWVSSDPWGWAPYRYGRWDYVSSVGWFWVPGRVWSGAWVSFAVSSSHVGWCPLNYWNRPVFHEPWVASAPAVSASRLDPRAWQFVPAGRFAARGMAVAATRSDHLPRGTEVLVTRSLPARLNPRLVATRTEPASGLYDQVRRNRVALPSASTSSGQPVSFRSQEQQLRAPAGASRRPTAPPRARVVAPRSAPAGAIPLPQQTTAAPAPRPREQSRPQPQARSRGPQSTAPQGSPAATPSRPPQANPSRSPQASPARPPREAAPAPPPQHDAAVGRLVGSVRRAPAAPPMGNAAPERPSQTVAPASQAEPDTPAPQGRGASRSDASRDKHQGKHQDKGPGKPGNRDNRGSGR